MVDSTVSRLSARNRTMNYDNISNTSKRDRIGVSLRMQMRYDKIQITIQKGGIERERVKMNIINERLHVTTPSS